MVSHNLNRSYSYVFSLLDVLFSPGSMFKTCLTSSGEGYITKEMNKDENYKTITSLTYVLCRKPLLENVFI